MATVHMAQVGSKVFSRWAPWLSGLVLVAGISAYVATRLASGGTALAPPRPVPLAPQARTVARAFVATAVARKDLERAWTLSAPELRHGMTLAEWETGSIPVTPYPVAKAAARWSVESSFADHAVLRVVFVPPVASATPRGDFLLTLRSSGGRWLVSSWVPRSIVSPPGG
jgi:hypothetical protein